MGDGNFFAKVLHQKCSIFGDPLPTITLHAGRKIHVDSEILDFEVGQGIKARAVEQDGDSAIYTFNSCNLQKSSGVRQNE